MNPQIGATVQIVRSFGGAGNRTCAGIVNGPQNGDGTWPVVCWTPSSVMVAELSGTHDESLANVGSFKVVSGANVGSFKVVSGSFGFV